MSDSELLTGFEFFPEFLSVKEESFLINCLEEINWQTVKMYGVTARRRVMHYGLSYTYDTRSVSPTTPVPDFLMPFIQRAAEWMQVEASEIVEILVTEYPTGAGIGWHRDAKVFGDKVLGISLAAECVMKLRVKVNDKFVVRKILLPRGSAYILGGEARTRWEHSISPLKSLRYSITFRTLK